MRNNTTFDVQSNVIFSNGKYYPFLYISDGIRKPVVRELDGDENLENVLNSLKSVNPTIVQALLTQ